MFKILFGSDYQNLWEKSRKLNENCRINIGKVGNVCRLGISLLSQHNTFEVPLRAINENDTEPIADHWIMYRSLGKGVF